ncbi:MAG: SAM-dependent chlorinase/fluorinase [Coriobacteriales bacterium]|nr:SAM-dependent chlorinase/fluorinase [Coriobacteriales bacterium]
MVAETALVEVWVQSIIGFTSDFGLDDTWVGVCHAVIYRACPQARVVDFGHNIKPFDIRAGAVVAAAGVFQLPEAIHLVVVDPGVGGGRADLCLVTERGTRLVGPDNGVLLPAANRAGGIAEAFSLEPDRLVKGGPLPTFHARDVLAPAAGALACGVLPSELGKPVASSDLSPAPFELASSSGNSVAAEVLEADRFGSLRFNVPAEQLGDLGLDAERFEIALGHNVLHVSRASTFADVSEGEPVVLLDSSGWLTLALNKSSAADRYGAQAGMHARITPQ